jgi:hypothetical protein
MSQTAHPEVWLRGAVDGIDGLLMPVAHALLQTREDIQRLGASVSAEDVWVRPGGAASIGFHIQHVGGATDRLFTYARGEALNDAQKSALAAEAAPPDPPPAIADVVRLAIETLDRALAQLRSTPPASLLEKRGVGRAALPSTVIGLLFHAGEHATRHAGQAITTARILSGAVT